MARERWRAARPEGALGAGLGHAVAQRDGLVRASARSQSAPRGASGVRFNDPIMDVGGGASTLVDDLLARGYVDITVLDISSRALEVAKQRLGAAANPVLWICADIKEADLGGLEFVVWYDRAASHFLTDEGSRTQYRRKSMPPSSRAE